MFQIKNLSKQYNNEFVLNDVTMTIGKGMNFIVGASGSGKTTLLKLISGMEKDFEGDIFYCDKEIRKLTDDEKSYFYNSIFGFVWQDFNLLEGMTVMENVLLPTNLNGTKDIVNAEKILNKLKLLEFAHTKVKNLSGGQKQRVAIARELMKDPEVILADEPTSALDESTAKETIAILREISKKKTVIVVTHDTALIGKNDNVFELDKGEYVGKSDIWKGKTPTLKKEASHKLTPKNAFSSVFTGVKRNMGRFSISAISLLLCSAMLLVSMCGIIGGGSNAAFDKLFKEYGDGLLDISIAGSFTDAGDTSGGGGGKPDGSVDQDIGGLYERYASDKRVEFVLYEQAFNNIKVTIGGKTVSADKSSNVPSLSRLLDGKMPGKSGKEVVVPENFAKKAGFSGRSILNKEIEFSATVYDWSSGSAVEKTIRTTATVVGVGENKVSYTDSAGKIQSFYVDDSFFFSKASLDDIRSQASMDSDKINFVMRCKNPKDMISLKEELNKSGIVPLGRFELVEDIVNLNSQTGSQSIIAIIALSVIAVVLLVAVYLMTAFMRKREYAIYKICGYSKGHLRTVGFMEAMAQFLITAALLLAFSPLLDLATKALFGLSILNAGGLLGGVGIALVVSVISFIISGITSGKTNLSTALKSTNKA